MWEAAVLLLKKRSAEKGMEKVGRLRTRLESLKRKPILIDSLRVHMNQEFNPDRCSILLDRLKDEKDIKNVIVDIRNLAEVTKDYINEYQREETDFQRASPSHRGLRACPRTHVDG